MWHLARISGFGAIVIVLLALAGSDELFAQKKKTEPQGTSATLADYILMNKKTEVFGTIISVGANGTTIALRVDTPHMEPNPNFKAPKGVNRKGGGNKNQQFQQARQYQEIQRQMQQAAKAKNPQEKQRLMRELQRDMAQLQQEQQRQYAQQMAQAKKGGKADGKGNANNQPFRLVHHLKDYEFELQEGAVLRKTFLPTEFDDIGNIKEYTDKVKAELRGADKTKPGYMAKLEELAPGAEAKLSLVPPKAAKKAAKEAKATDDDEGVGNIERSSVKMVVLTKEAVPFSSSGGAPKKKDKK